MAARTLVPALLISLLASSTVFAQGFMPVFQVDEKVYHEGWQTCGHIIVFADRSYEWRRINVWNDTPTENLSTGELSVDLLNDLKETAHLPSVGKTVEMIPVYEYYVDDSKTIHPESIKELIDLLTARHP